MKIDEILLGEHIQIFEEHSRRLQAEIDTGRDYFLTPERPHDAEYCDFLRECGYRVPKDWPTVAEKEES